MTGLFLQDFVVGARYSTATARIDAAEIKAFASLYDPQPFHLDDAAAEASFFRGLSASGWHTGQRKETPPGAASRRITSLWLPHSVHQTRVSCHSDPPSTRP